MSSLMVSRGTSGFRLLHVTFRLVLTCYTRIIPAHESSRREPLVRKIQAPTPCTRHFACNRRVWSCVSEDMSRTILMLSILLGALAAPIGAQTAAPATPSSEGAQPDNCHHHRHHGWFLKHLNLTDAQKQQVRGIFQANRTAN